MIGRSEGLGVVTGPGAIAETIGSVAEEGSAFGDMEETEFVLLTKDDGAGPFSALEEPVHDRLADAVGWAFGVVFGILEEGFVGIGAVVVGAVFPDVSGHIVEAEVVGWVGLDRCRAGEAIFSGVVVGEFSGEDVGEPFFAGLGFVAPDVYLLLFSAPGGEFPFGFGGETFASPFAVGIGIFPGDADDGVVVLALNVGVGTGRVEPAGSLGKAPPLPFSAFTLELDGIGRAGEDEGAGFEAFGRGFWEIFVAPAAFGLGLVIGGVGEFFPLGIGDLVGLDVEAVDFHVVDGAFFGIERKTRAFGGAAGVGGTFNPDHSFGRSGVENSGEGEK